jgi:hypothetical protein
MEYTGALKLGALYRRIGRDSLLLFDYAANLNQQENHLQCNLRQKLSHGSVVVAFYVEEVLGSNSFKVSLLLPDGTFGTLWQTYLKTDDWEQVGE